MNEKKGRKSLRARISVGKYDIWRNLNAGISAQKIIPIISNSIVNNRIFDIDDDGCIGVSRDVAEKTEERQYRIEEQLAREWAEFIKYPLAESPLQLCRVAQYNRVISQNADEAKRKYLAYLKLCLLELAINDKEVSDIAKQLAEPVLCLLEKEVSDIANQLAEPISDLTDFSDIVVRLEPLSFSEIAFQLGYPKFENENQNPLHLLAQLPLPLYVTTSPHDFMERALRAVRKHPRIQVCSWFGDPLEPEWFGDPPEPEADVNSDPTEATPLVYHLYGLEKYPKSLVISEDDYLDFLVTVSEHKGTIPRELWGILAKSSLLLLGYRLRCWDFRVLFRGIIKSSRSLESTNFAIQLNPPVQQSEETSEEKMQEALNQARQYLQDYFEPSKFRVEWYDTTSFVQELVQKWRDSRK